MLCVANGAERSLAWYQRSIVKDCLAVGVQLCGVSGANSEEVCGSTEEQPAHRDR
jgi:hypothetical protein